MRIEIAKLRILENNTRTIPQQTKTVVIQSPTTSVIFQTCKVEFTVTHSPWTLSDFSYVIALKRGTTILTISYMCTHTYIYLYGGLFK